MTPSGLRYEVERAGHSPYFFTSKSMKFFGDRMSNYGVRSARAITYSGDELEVWELYRRHPVKHGLQSSAFFRKDTFERVHPKPLQNPKKQKRFYLPFEVSTWFERDRANVRVDDAKGNTLFDWWDETVGELVEDGFLDGRDWKGSALDYAASLLGYKDYYNMRIKVGG